MTSPRPARDQHDARFAQMLRHAYGLRAAAVIRLKTVTGIVDEDGRRWVWKPLRDGCAEERLAAVAEAAELLTAAGLPFAGPVPGRGGRYLTTPGDGPPGCLQPWLPGRHADYTVRQERLAAVATLAAMHRIAHGTQLSARAALYRGNLYEKLWLKRRLLDALWPRAASSVPALRELREPALRAADLALHSVHPGGAGEDAPWARLTFCHRDVAPHNLLWQGAGPLAVIDFDLCGMDDPLIDVMQLSNHALFLGVPAAGHFTELTEVYLRGFPLSRAGERALWRVLAFPDLLARAVTEWVRADEGRDVEPALRRLVHAARRQAEHLEAWAKATRGLPV
ncbi:phosphotransferase [Alicyclobacillus sp.]|uniref:phosphotransferase n=1 Tax=Alicyclobacillus sp. TaxID=61169 RepID=UPI0025BF9FB8|nr:phosphotransferase [Alicyclobacillus sp.]MCL6516499.1 phosphotransferase [Alicyclobacillus sp.]